MSKHTTNRAGEQLYDMLKDMGWLPYSDKDSLSYRDIENLLAALANFTGPDDALDLRLRYRKLKRAADYFRSCIDGI
ncbi:MAG: hypothetical protein SO053_01285 [Bifidobacterium animalis]|nr:hypothetical protein [Bifidobacterium animalis]MDY5039778.1 hypothetical protein [Bifidobacterium animalis]